MDLTISQSGNAVSIQLWKATFQLCHLVTTYFKLFLAQGMNSQA